MMNRSGSTRPDPTMTPFDGLFLNFFRRYELDFFQIIDSGLKIVVSNFDTTILIHSTVIAFFEKTGFCHVHVHFAYNSRTITHFQNLIISHERTSEDLSESLRVSF